jgi:hypothetical protein
MINGIISPYIFCVVQCCWVILSNLVDCLVTWRIIIFVHSIKFLKISPLAIFWVIWKERNHHVLMTNQKKVKRNTQS